MTKHYPLLGGHVSVAGGLWNAIANGESIGAGVIQVFGASPRKWYARMPGKDEVKKFSEARKNSRVERVYLHAAYLVNLASPVQDVIQKSIKNLSEHLMIAEMIGANGLIFHVGSGKELPRREAIGRAGKAMTEVLKKVSGRAQLIIENAAGGGEKLGANAGDVGQLMNLLDSDRVKVCLDTAHAFEAGLIEKYESPEIGTFLKDWDAEVGLKNIVALHVNDSKTAFNSHHDRHENLGQGHIGLRGFQNLTKESALHDKSWILEVPGFDNGGPDRKNMEILASCFQ